ncbi:MAG: zinc ribbon domain-containing protein [Ruminococcaceae bacterium]|nr:zinc ribbon domain-containing protein [Oscillospiraceae bacterium]
MNCTRCNAPLEEDALYCKSCGTQHAVLEQKAKIEGITANIKGLIVTKLKSPLFLVAAILFSIMFASTISSVFSGGFAGIAGSILSFIFMLIATIGMWKGYASKTPADAASALRKASIYDAYQRVMYTISIVLTSIMAVICIILVALGGQAIAGVLASAGLVEDSESAAGGGIIAILLVTVIFAITIAVISIFRGIYAKRRAYFMALAQTAETGSYTAAKAPVVGSYILGGYSVLSSISTIAFALVGQALLNGLVAAVIAEMDLPAELSEMLLGLVSSAMSGFVFAGIGSLITGAYMILSAVWMAKVHSAQVANAEAANIEQARLVVIENATREAMAADEAKKRAEEEAKKAEMMQMMQMMMAQNMNAQNAQAAPAPEAPATPNDEA